MGGHYFILEQVVIKKRQTATSVIGSGFGVLNHICSLTTYLQVASYLEILDRVHIVWVFNVVGCLAPWT